MNLFIASIHHTGTQFTVDLLQRAGYKYINRNWPEPRHQQRLFRQHIEVRSMPLLLETLSTLDVLCGRGARPIVPLRHPVLCAQSWARRHKSIDDMIEQWNWLLDEIDPYNPVYFPIDLPDRSLYLQSLSEYVGQDLETDWHLVGAKPGNTPPTDEDLVKVAALIQEESFQEVLGEYYPNVEQPPRHA